MCNLWITISKVCDVDLVTTSNSVITTETPSKGSLTKPYSGVRGFGNLLVKDNISIKCKECVQSSHPSRI